MEKEIWKSLDFIGYPDYEVSTLGNVKSLNYRGSGKERLLKPIKIKLGYCVVGLYKNTKPKIFTVHKLVALAFIPNIQNSPMINHKNEIKTDNRVENLEWCDCKYNLNYGTCKERISKKMKGRKLSEETKQKMSKPKSEEHKQKLRKPIFQFTKDMVFVREFDSATTASQELNINNSHITACCRGKRKTCGGFVWRYK